MPLPLDGIRVLDLGISTAGPYAARVLADLGAEVIKVEPLDGENSRSLGLQRLRAADLTPSNADRAV